MKLLSLLLACVISLLPYSISAAGTCTATAKGNYHYSHTANPKSWSMTGAGPNVIICCDMGSGVRTSVAEWSTYIQSQGYTAQDLGNCPANSRSHHFKLLYGGGGGGGGDVLDFTNN